MARIEAEVMLTNIYEYERPSFSWGTETAYIYTMKDDDGTVYVWKTTSIMGFEERNDDGDGYIVDREDGRWYWKACRKGDVIRIRATVKGESEYKGKHQTVINRVKVMERIKRGLAREEWEDIKRKKQLDSIVEGDIIVNMTYNNYKKHYSDCETLAGSFKSSENEPSTIDVIVRNGRLVPSGVRGKSFEYYEISYKQGKIVGSVFYKAVCEDNALRRFYKCFPDAEITDIRYDSY